LYFTKISVFYFLFCSLLLYCLDLFFVFLSTAIPYFTGGAIQNFIVIDHESSIVRPYLQGGPNKVTNGITIWCFAVYLASIVLMFMKLKSVWNTFWPIR